MLGINKERDQDRGYHVAKPNNDALFFENIHFTICDPNVSFRRPPEKPGIEYFFRVGVCAQTTNRPCMKVMYRERIAGLSSPNHFRRTLRTRQERRLA